MEIKIYQIVIEKYSDPKEQRKCYCNCIGVISGKNPDVEVIWNLTNHSCGLHEQELIKSNDCIYTPTVYDKGCTNDDIFFEKNGIWQCADFFGWTEVKTFDEAKQHIFENALGIKACLPKNYTYKQIIDR